jgi:outer membrane protein assembly factor BamB
MTQLNIINPGVDTNFSTKLNENFDYVFETSLSNRNKILNTQSKLLLLESIEGVEFRDFDSSLITIFPTRLGYGSGHVIRGETDASHIDNYFTNEVTQFHTSSGSSSNSTNLLREAIATADNVYISETAEFISGTTGVWEVTVSVEGSPVAQKFVTTNGLINVKFKPEDYSSFAMEGNSITIRWRRTSGSNNLVYNTVNASIGSLLAINDPSGSFYRWSSDHGTPGHIEFKAVQSKKVVVAFPGKNINKVYAYVDGDKEVTSDYGTSFEKIRFSTGMAGFAGGVRAVAIGDDGLFVGGNNQRLAKYDFNGELMWSKSFASNQNPRGLAFDYSNGDIYVCGGTSAFTKRINKDSVEVWGNSLHSSEVNDVVIDDNFVYTGSNDNAVRKRNKSNGANVWAFTGHSSNVNGVAVDSSGNVYSASSDNTVRKLNSSGTQQWSFTGHTGNANAVIVTPDGSAVYSGSSDATIRRINSSGSEVWSVDIDTLTGVSVNVFSLRFDGDGNILWGSASGYVGKLDADGNEIWTYRPYNNNMVLDYYAGHILFGAGLIEDNNAMYAVDETPLVLQELELGTEIDVDDFSAVSIELSGGEPDTKKKLYGIAVHYWEDEE